MIGFAKRLDDGISHFQVCFHRFVLIGYVGNEDVIDAPVELRFCVVAVVVHPPDLAILTDDPVRFKVGVVFAEVFLFRLGVGYILVIVRQKHPPESVTCQRAEFFFVLTGENIEHRLVCIQDFFISVGSVDQETAGDMPADLFDNRQSRFVHLKVFSKHLRPPGI